MCVTLSDGRMSLCSKGKNAAEQHARHLKHNQQVQDYNAFYCDDRVTLTLLVITVFDKFSITMTLILIL